MSNYDWCTYYLTWTSVPSITPKTYIANSTALVVTFSAFTWTPANCTSTVAYTATLVDGSALPSYVTFTAAGRKFAVYTNDVT